MYVSGDYLVGDSKEDFAQFNQKVHLKLFKYINLKGRRVGDYAGLFRETIGSDSFSLKQFYANVEKVNKLSDFDIEVISWIESYFKFDYLDLDI